MGSDWFRAGPFCLLARLIFHHLLQQQQQQQQQRCYRSHLSSGSVFFFCCENRDVFSVLIVATYSPVVKLAFCSLLFLEVWRWLRLANNNKKTAESA
ncbi:unnamed protein product [Sphagnum jensenii]|uniref:Secreted protein n=1 Tax=Sphagnum jensenii TaxID=128206 RepID=A0ABP1B4K1_9BRYO